jgi:hypothetical protein
MRSERGWLGALRGFSGDGFGCRGIWQSYGLVAFGWRGREAAVRVRYRCELAIKSPRWSIFHTAEALQLAWRMYEQSGFVRSEESRLFSAGVAGAGIQTLAAVIESYRVFFTFTPTRTPSL